MIPRIETLSEKKLVGKWVKTSISNKKTTQLWQSFMPRRSEIKNSIGNDLYSIQVYSPMYFNSFNPNAEFTQWAAAEVTNFDTVPNEMEIFIVPSGLYAVFLFVGDISKAHDFFQYIFRTWLPSSEYDIDTRPHFEIIGEKYKNNDPTSEEEIWIPIKSKING